MNAGSFQSFMDDREADEGVDSVGDGAGVRVSSGLKKGSEPSTDALFDPRRLPREQTAKLLQAHVLRKGVSRWLPILRFFRDLLRLSIDFRKKIYWVMVAAARGQQTVRCWI